MSTDLQKTANMLDERVIIISELSSLQTPTVLSLSFDLKAPTPNCSGIISVKGQRLIS